MSRRMHLMVAAEGKGESAETYSDVAICDRCAAPVPPDAVLPLWYDASRDPYPLFCAKCQVAILDEETQNRQLVLLAVKHEGVYDEVPVWPDASNPKKLHFRDPRERTEAKEPIGKPSKPKLISPEGFSMILGKGGNYYAGGLFYKVELGEQATDEANYVELKDFDRGFSIYTHDWLRIQSASPELYEYGYEAKPVEQAFTGMQADYHQGKWPLNHEALRFLQKGTTRWYQVGNLYASLRPWSKDDTAVDFILAVEAGVGAEWWDFERRFRTLVLRESRAYTDLTRCYIEFCGQAVESEKVRQEAAIRQKWAEEVKRSKKMAARANDGFIEFEVKAMRERLDRDKEDYQFRRGFGQAQVWKEFISEHDGFTPYHERRGLIPSVQPPPPVDEFAVWKFLETNLSYLPKSVVYAVACSPEASGFQEFLNTPVINQWNREALRAILTAGDNHGWAEVEQLIAESTATMTPEDYAQIAQISPSTAKEVVNRELQLVWEPLWRSDDAGALSRMLAAPETIPLSPAAKEAFQHEATEALRIRAQHQLIAHGISYVPRLLQCVTALRILHNQHTGVWTYAGSGKTLAIILALKLTKSPIRQLTVIGPVGVENQWRERVRENFGVRVAFKYVHYSSLSSSYPPFLGENKPYNFVVIDEAHTVKNRNPLDMSLRRQRLIEILNRMPKAKRILATATASVNAESYREPISLLELIGMASGLKTKNTIKNGLQVHFRLLGSGVVLDKSPVYNESLLNIVLTPQEVEVLGLLKGTEKVAREHLLVRPKLLAAHQAGVLTPGTIIVSHFTDADKILETIADTLKALHLKCAVYSAELISAVKREEVLLKFVSGQVDVLICSRVVYEGIDGLHRRMHTIVNLSPQDTYKEECQLIGRARGREDLRFVRFSIDDVSNVRSKRVVHDIILQGKSPQEHSRDQLIVPAKVAIGRKVKCTKTEPTR